MADFSIGTLSKKTGCKVPTIRYYENIGLLQEPYRTEGNQRRYQSKHLNTLRFILHSRELGFTLDDIRELMALENSDAGKDHKADEIAAKHLNEIEHKITGLAVLKNELSMMLKACIGGESNNCSVIDALSDHSLCKGKH